MVALGIAISFLGSLMLMPSFNASINMISLFAFLVIIGIVVDDAIVVGENIFVHKRNKKPLLAAVEGTKEVSNAVIFAGLTTIAAFSPLLFAGGFMGYSSAPMYEQALAELEARNPEAVAQYNRMFV